MTTYIPLKTSFGLKSNRRWSGHCAKYAKHHFEILAIVNSWGDTMNDKEVLAAFCRLNKAGSIFEHITDRG